MYDGTDVALVLGALLSAGIGCVLIIGAGIAFLMWIVTKAKGAGSTGAAKYTAYFLVSALLCGGSIASGYFVYEWFPHQRGAANPPEHVLAVALASCWGPVAAGVLGLWFVRKRRSERANEEGADAERSSIR